MILAGSASLCQRHNPLNPVGFVLWKLGVGNWELCLICISPCLTDVSLDLLPCRFPFGQALAEALKTNTSVTSIKLQCNSIGDEGVKAFCVPGFQVAAHGASAYSWCWGSDSVDPDWRVLRVLRVLRASAVGDVIVPSSEEKGTAHSQALKQVIEEKKKMGFELDIEFYRDLSWAEPQKSTPRGRGGTVCLLLSVRDLHVYCLIMIIFDWSRAPVTCEMPQCTIWSFFGPKIDRLGISTWNGDRKDFCVPKNPQKTIPNLWFIGYAA